MNELINLLIIVAIIGIIYWTIKSVDLPTPIRIAVQVICAIISIYILYQFIQ